MKTSSQLSNTHQDILHYQQISVLLNQEQTLHSIPARTNTHNNIITLNCNVHLGSTLLLCYCWMREKVDPPAKGFRWRFFCNLRWKTMHSGRFWIHEIQAMLSGALGFSFQCRCWNICGADRCVRATGRRSFPRIVSIQYCNC